jgi:hypothetical protein
MNTIKQAYSLYTNYFGLTKAIPVASSLFCGVTAVEMAFRTVADSFQIMQRTNTSRAKANFSADAAGAIFYGLCAANFIPGTPIIGATIFVFRSLATYKDTDTYLISKFVGKSLRAIQEYVATPLYDYAIQPVWNHMVQPLILKISNFIMTVLKILKIPDHPTWYGVAFLLSAIWLRHEIVIVSTFSARMISEFGRYFF